MPDLVFSSDENSDEFYDDDDDVRNRCQVRTKQGGKQRGGPQVSPGGYPGGHRPEVDRETEADQGGQTGARCEGELGGAGVDHDTEERGEALLGDDSGVVNGGLVGVGDVAIHEVETGRRRGQRRR